MRNRIEPIELVLQLHSGLVSWTDHRWGPQGAAVLPMKAQVTLPPAPSACLSAFFGQNPTSTFQVPIQVEGRRFIITSLHPPKALSREGQEQGDFGTVHSSLGMLVPSPRLGVSAGLLLNVPSVFQYDHEHRLV